MLKIIKKINRNTIYPLLVVFLVACCLGVYFWQHNKLNSNSVKISSLSDANSKLQSANSKLSIELNNANSSIASLAQKGIFTPNATCQTQQLSLAYSSRSGGLAGAGGIFTYQNISKSPCTVNGYPGFLAMDSSGHVAPDGPIKTSNTPLGGPELISLKPDAKAYFLVGWDSNMMGNSYNPKNCLNAALVESTPPGNTMPIIDVTNDAKIYICNGPTFITPLVNEQTINKY